MPSHEEVYRDRLKEAFPSEAANIDTYFHDVMTATEWMSMTMVSKAIPSWAAFFVGLFGRDKRALALQTTKRYLESRFEDPRLRAVLASQWPDYGLSPEESAFGIHAIVSGSYFSGGYYPVGGAQSIAPPIIEGIESAGGQALVNQEVTEILLEDGRAIGVRAKHPAREDDAVEYRAPIVISNVGARTTYLRLLPETLDLPFRDELRNFRYGHSAVTCYLGLKEDPASIGVHGENHWNLHKLRSRCDVPVGDQRLEWRAAMRLCLLSERQGPYREATYRRAHPYGRRRRIPTMARQSLEAPRP